MEGRGSSRVEEEEGAASPDTFSKLVLISVTQLA